MRELDITVLADGRRWSIALPVQLRDRLAHFAEERPEQMHPALKDDRHQMLALDIGVDLFPGGPVATALQPPVVPDVRRIEGARKHVIRAGIPLRPGRRRNPE